MLHRRILFYAGKTNGRLPQVHGDGGGKPGGKKTNAKEKGFGLKYFHTIPPDCSFQKSEA